MKNLIALARIAFKPVAVLKYLFFPFMIAQSQDTFNFSEVLNNQKVVARVQTQTSVWIGTDNGLYRVNRLNGKFVHLTTGNSVLPSNHIKGICATSNENVYVLTANGILRFDGVSFLQVSSENTNLPDDKFTAIACDERDRIFIGTQNSGLVMMQGNKCKTFNKSNAAFTSNTIVKVYCDENGLIIAEQGNGNIMVIGLNQVAAINNPNLDLNAIVSKN